MNRSLHVNAPMELIWSIGNHGASAAVAELAAIAFDPEFGEAWNAMQIAGIAHDKSGWLNLAHAPDNALVAFALNRQAADEVELLLCAIHPRIRRRGVGRQLLENLCRISHMRGARRVFLEVRATNDPALLLYQSCGFVPCGIRPGYYRSVSGEKINAITLERAL